MIAAVRPDGVISPCVGAVTPWMARTTGKFQCRRVDASEDSRPPVLGDDACIELLVLPPRGFLGEETGEFRYPVLLEELAPPALPPALVTALPPVAVRSSNSESCTEEEAMPSTAWLRRRDDRSGEEPSVGATGASAPPLSSPSGCAVAAACTAFLLEAVPLGEPRRLDQEPESMLGKRSPEPEPELTPELEPAVLSPDCRRSELLLRLLFALVTCLFTKC